MLVHLCEFRPFQDDCCRFTGGINIFFQTERERERANCGIFTKQFSPRNDIYIYICIFTPFCKSILQD